LWRGKVIAQMIESTLIVWEELGSSPMYAILCVVWVILILICMIMLGDNIIIELEELTQTWLGWIGYALTLEL